MLPIVVHNEEGLELFCREVSRVVPDIVPQVEGVKLLFVDDGSSDETLAMGACIVRFTAAALLVVFIVVHTLLFGDLVSGWLLLVCAVLLVEGFRLFRTDFLGQYLAKAYLETKCRLLYFVDVSSEEGFERSGASLVSPVGGVR